MEKILQLCDAAYEKAVEYRRAIHRHPEIGMECPETTDYICSVLDTIGIAYRRTGSSGAIADIKGTGGESNAVVMLRADMDALPQQERTGLPYASETEGRMHACGHDMHTAMLLAAAGVLHACRDRFAGTVRLLFQPGEEISKGAKMMIRENAMEGVCMGLGIHMDPLSPVGVLRAKTGPDWAAVDQFTITLRGTGAHGATPQKGVDATVAAAALVMNLQTMVSRETDPMHPLVVTVGKLHSGTAYNIISSEAVLEGTCRSFDEDVYDHIPEAMERIVQSTAQAYRCTAQLDLERHCRPLVNDEDAYNMLKKTAEITLDDADSFLPAVQEMIGEDFALFAGMAPCVFAHLGCDGEYPLHSPYVNFKEEAMRYGIRTEAVFALRALEAANERK